MHDRKFYRVLTGTRPSWPGALPGTGIEVHPAGAA